VARGPSPITPVFILSLGLLAATAPLSLDAYLPALPAMARDFAVPPQVIQASLTACMFGLGVGQIVAGPLGDRFGRKVPMIVGAIVYIAASIACAFAPSATAFAAFRFVQGLAGGVGLVLSRAVVQDVAEGRTAARLYAQMGATSLAAPVLAPIAGALIITFGGGWRTVFGMLALLGLLMLVAVVVVIGETHPAEKRTSAAVRPVLRAFGSLLRDRSFRGHLLLVGLSSALLFSYISSAPFVLQETFSLTQFEFALAFGVVGCGLVAISLFTSRVVRRHSPLRVLAISALVQLAGVVVLTFVVWRGFAFGDVPSIVLVVALVWAVAPSAAVSPICVSYAMARSRRRAGAASALIGAGMFAAGGIVTPISGAAGTALAMPVLMLGASVALVVGILATARADRTDP
jgi:DHA1 family bicyclomycin/chloramphenicol resistance-like MFS transporter